MLSMILASDPATPAASDSTAAALSTLPSGAAIIGNLAMVIIAIVAAAWLVSRLRRQGVSDSGGIRVVASCALSHRDRVIVMAIGDEQIVVGVSGQSMVRLHELSKPLPERETTLPLSFANKLKRLRQSPLEESSQ
ncbi:MAG: flagellar biosynthetic protein FliO [Pseudomonadota bacterium]